VYTIAFGSLEGSETLKTMANTNNDSGCGGRYFEGRNQGELDKIFHEISALITYSLQSINLTNKENDILYPSSYIEIDTNEEEPEPPEGSIKFMSQTSNFNGCHEDIDLSGFMKMDEAKITSYSGDGWTSRVNVNGEEIFNIYDYGYDLSRTGDPFVLQVPDTESKKFIIDMQTIDKAGRELGCSDFNRMIYTAYLPRMISVYSDILEYAEGCRWNISFADGTYKTVYVPSDYDGEKQCNFTENSVDYDDLNKKKIYDINDAVDTVMFSLLTQLDVNREEGSEGRIDISIDENDLNTKVESIKGIPYLWGPAVLEVSVWR